MRSMDETVRVPRLPEGPVTSKLLFEPTATSRTPPPLTSLSTGCYEPHVTPLEERRDRVRYLVLTTLHDAPPESLPMDYPSIAPGIDDFEVRAAASWLVGNRYARMGDRRQRHHH
jgi:hypothetical protein